VTVKSPLIDPRDRDALAAQTTKLATRFSGWQPPPERGSDPATALIGVFARFAELVVERINKAPDRGYLSFLNLIGTQPLPPQPARVPLSFLLAEGSTAEAVVPAGTQVAAPATDTEPDEVLFETDTALVITRAGLRSVFVRDPENDRYSDHSGTIGSAAEAFAVFAGDAQVPHQLFIGFDPLWTQEGSARLSVLLRGTEPEYWLAGGQVSWAARDGAGWRPVTPESAVLAPFGGWTVQFAGLPVLPAFEVNGISASWLRAQLDVPLATPEPGPPDAVGVGRRALQEMAPGLAPFGDPVQVKWFYVIADVPPGALARIVVSPSRPGRAAGQPPVQLIWTYKAGNDWIELGRSGPADDGSSSGAGHFQDGSRAFTQPGEISFRARPDWTPSVFNGRRGRWLRIEVGGDYATLPVLDALTVRYEWALPTLDSIEMVKQNPPSRPLTPPAAGLLNGVPLDISKDFLPFGEAPAFNDTLYLECPPAVAMSGTSFTLSVTLTNAAGKASAPPPVILTPAMSWETFDGTRWRPATASRANAFTVDGDVGITPAAPLAATDVGGESALWMRARLVGAGGYGLPAGYRPKPSGDGYEFGAATLAPPVVAALGWKPAPATSVPVTAGVTCNALTYTTQMVRPYGAGGAPFQPFVPGPDLDPALYLGFDRPFEPSPVSLYLPVEPPSPDEVAADRLTEPVPSRAAQVVWEYWGLDGSGTAGWQPLAAVDETGTLASRGVVQFVGPPDMASRQCFGAEGFWLRARWRSGDFAVVPRLRGVLPNTTWATQVTTIRDEILGSGNGNAGQVFSTAQTPVLAGQRVLVREPELPPPVEVAALVAVEGDDAVTLRLDESGVPEEIWVRWHAVADFYGSGPQDRHYTVDPLTGQVRFGDGQSGRLPPIDQNNIRISYRTGGGAAGNRAAGAVSELKAALPYVDSVVNHEAAQGGAGRESIERLSDRGPRVLRHRDRAITAQDLEDLAYESSTEVARARATPPGQFDPTNLWLDPEKPLLLAQHELEDAGRVGVIVVPDSADVRPTPSLGLLRRVRDYLITRCSATAEVAISGPEWIRVTVTATAVPVPGELSDAVRARVREAVERYLHPLTGGPAGQGWAFGRKPHRSDLFALIEAIPGVDHVQSLAVAHEPESQMLGPRLTDELNRSLTASGRQPPPPDLQRWLDRALVYSGRHDITMTLRG
jgi:hypothetical protein